MKTWHRRAGSFAVLPCCGSQQINDLSVAAGWYSSDARCCDRPARNALSRFVEHRCARKPLRTVNIAITIARGVAVTTGGEPFHYIFPASNKLCFIASFRSQIRLLLVCLLSKDKLS